MILMSKCANVSIVAPDHSARHHVDDAVDVMQRQEQRDAVVGLPSPGFDQGLDLCLQIRVRRNNSFRLAGRTTGVQNHRATRSVDLRKRGLAIGNVRNFFDHQQPHSESLAECVNFAGKVSHDHDAS